MLPLVCRWDFETEDHTWCKGINNSVTLLDSTDVGELVEHQIYYRRNNLILPAGGSMRQGAENIFLEAAKEKHILNAPVLGHLRVC